MTHHDYAEACELAAEVLESTSDLTGYRTYREQCDDARALRTLARALREGRLYESDGRGHPHELTITLPAEPGA